MRHAQTCAALLLTHGVLAAQVPPVAVSPAPIVRFEYRAEGQLKSRIEAPGALGLTTALGHDRLMRTTVSTDPRGKPTLFDHDALDALVSVTDPRGLQTQSPRNGLGDVTSLVSPDTGTTTFLRDAVGNAITRTDSRGVVARTEYDTIDRLRGVSYSLPGRSTENFSWTYDETGPGSSNGVGRLTSTQSPTSSARYSYDAFGRLTRATQTVLAPSAVTHATDYTYDSAGRITSVTYPSGRVLHLTLEGGVPTALSLAASAGSPSVPLVSGIQWEPNPGSTGAVRGWQWHLDSGTVRYERVFDTWGRLVRYPLGGALRDLVYDEASRIVRYVHHDALTGAPVPGLDQTFTYDDASRLVAVRTGAGDWDLAYDDTGNRTSTTFSAPGVTSATRVYATPDNSNRLTALSNPERLMLHDAAGNTLSDLQGGLGYLAEHDLSGRISRLRTTLAGGWRYDTSYGYNVDGLRVLKHTASAQRCITAPSGAAICSMLQSAVGIVYVYDLAGQLLGEYDALSGQVVREYVWLQGMPLAVVDGAPSAERIAYVQADHLGAPRVVIDRGGRQRWSWLAEPFGHSAPIENPVGAGVFTLNLRLPGQYWDRESGLANNWHRTYDSGVGRYTQSDPIGLAGGVNTYAYVNGAPTIYTDPMGLFLGPWHTSFSNVAMRDSGYGERVASRVAGFSTGADWIPGSQATWNAHWHAMCTIGVPKSECQRRHEEYIEQQISTCTASGLGRAMHAAQDSAARGHAGWQYWGGGIPSSEHLKGDSDPTDAEQATAIARSKLIIRRFKAKCPCTELGPYSN